VARAIDDKIREALTVLDGGGSLEMLGAYDRDGKPTGRKDSDMVTETRLAKASRRTARLILSRARRKGLSLDTWVEASITIDGVRLSAEEAKVVRWAVGAYYACFPIATPVGVHPLRDLVRGVNVGRRFDRAPARAANVISFHSATPLR
jgi:hypothetical protein